MAYYYIMAADCPRLYVRSFQQLKELSLYYF
jgi:hypothetical protein